MGASVTCGWIDVMDGWMDGWWIDLLCSLSLFLSSMADAFWLFWRTQLVMQLMMQLMQPVADGATNSRLSKPLLTTLFD